MKLLGNTIQATFCIIYKMNNQLALRRSAALLRRSSFYGVPKYLRYAQYASSFGRGLRTARNIYSGARRTNRFVRRVMRKVASNRRKRSQFRPYASTGGRLRRFDEASPTAATYDTIPFKNLAVYDLKLPATQRLGNRIRLNGVKICFELFNVTASPRFPVEVHMALVQLADEEAAADIDKGFFRGFDLITGNASFDFEDFTTNPNYDLRYKCNPLSTDRKRVLTHKKFIVEKGDNTYNIPQSPYYLKHDKYYKINRHIQFDTNSDIVNEKPFKLCFWVMPVDGGLMPSPTNTNAIKLQVQFEGFYSNVV